MRLFSFFFSDGFLNRSEEITKWSDSNMSTTVRSSISVAQFLISQSKVWPWWWVGTLTNWCKLRLSSTISAAAQPLLTSFARSKYSRALLLSLNAQNTALAPDVCRRLHLLGIYDGNQACSLWKRKKRTYRARYRHRGKTVDTIRHAMIAWLLLLFADQFLVVTGFKHWFISWILCSLGWSGVCVCVDVYIICVCV